MFAPMIDMPMGISSLSGQYRRPEYFTNTPYHKANEDSRSHYRFVDGFYESATSTFTNPLVELQRNEIMRRAQQIVDRWNAAALTLNHVDPLVVLDVCGKLIYALVSQGFVKTTFEKTPDDSLLITGEWQGKLVYADVFFDADEPAGYEVVLNAYKDKQPVLTVTGTLEAVFTSLLGYAPNLPTPLVAASQPV